MKSGALLVSDAAELPITRQVIPDVPEFMAVIRRLSAAHSLEEIMTIVTHGVRTLLGADGVTFVLRDGDRCYYAEEDAISPLWKGKRFPMSACISGWCMLEREPVMIRDIYQDPRIPHDAYRPTFVHSLAMVPIRQDDPVGALGAYWAKIRDANKDELEQLQTIANAASLTIARVEQEYEREKAQIVQAETFHRLKNVFSIVDALSRQISRSASTPQDYAKALSGRLQALSRAHGLLTQSHGKGTDLGALIHEQLAGDDDNRIFCRGPDIALPSNEALDLGLVVHELSTNARKYGALSREGGQVAIVWDVKPDGNRRVLEISWTEEGGPQVTPPDIAGFGSALFGYVFKRQGGEAKVRYAPGGVICNMRIPLP
jgi:two-component sensor histidine kinase